MSIANNAGCNGSNNTYNTPQNNQDVGQNTTGRRIVEKKLSPEIKDALEFWKIVPKSDEMTRDIFSDILSQAYSDQDVVDFLSEIKIQPNDGLFSTTTPDKGLSEPTELRKKFERLRPDAAEKFFSVDNEEKKPSEEVLKLKNDWEALTTEQETEESIEKTTHFLHTLFNGTHSDEDILCFLPEIGIQPDNELFSNKRKATELRTQFEQSRSKAARTFFANSAPSAIKEKEVIIIDEEHQEEHLSQEVQDLKAFWETLPRDDKIGRSVLSDIFRGAYSDQDVLNFLLEVNIRPNGGFFLREDNQPTNLRTEFEQSRPEVAKTFFSSHTSKNSPYTLTLSDLPLDFKLEVGALLNIQGRNAFSETSKEFRDLSLVSFQKKNLYDFAINMALKITHSEKFIQLKKIIDAQIRDNDIDAAKKTAFLMNSDPLDFNYSLCQIAIAQAKKDDISGAEETLSSINDPTCRIYTLLEIAKAKVTKKDQEGARAILASLKEFILSTEESLNRITNLREVARIEANFDSITRASITLNLAKEVVFSSGKPPTYRCNQFKAIAQDEIALGERKAAERTLLLAEQFALQIDDDRKIACLKEIAILHIRNGDKDRAEETKEKVFSFETDVSKKHFIFKEIIKAQIEMNDKEAIKKTSLQARDNSPAIKNQRYRDGGSYERDAVLAEIVQWQVDADDISEATKTIDLIETPHSRLIALQKIAFAQFKENKKKAASETLLVAKGIASQIENRFSQHTTLIQIARTQVATDDISGAQSTLTSLTKEVSSIEKKDRCAALLNIARVYLKIGDMTEVEKLFSAIKEEALSENSLLSLYNVYTEIMSMAEIQIELNNIPQARETILLVKDIALTMKTEDARSSLLQEIAKFQVQIGDKEEAKETLLQAKPTTFLPHSIYNNVDMLKNIAKLQAQMGDKKEAKETLLKAKEITLLAFHNNTKILLLEKIAVAQAEMEDIQGTQETLIDLKKLNEFSRVVDVTLDLISALNKVKS